MTRAAPRTHKADGICPAPRLPEHLDPWALRLAVAAGDMKGLRTLLSCTHKLEDLRGVVLALLSSDETCQPGKRHTAYALVDRAVASQASMWASAVTDDRP